MATKKQKNFNNTSLGPSVKNSRKQEISLQRSKNPLLTAIIIITGLFFLSIIFASTIGLALLFSGSGIDETGNVAVIKVKGTISTGNTESFGMDASSTQILSHIKKANEDPEIEAIIIEIDSPGGSPVASEEIMRAVKESEKPSVAWIRESGTSGAYWIASGANHIIAHPLSITASIGVYGSYLEFSSLLEEKNVTYQRLVSGERKDTGSRLRALSYSEEQVLQAKIDFMHEYFIASVAENRNLSEDYVREYADGMFMLGQEAYDAKLIDELGSQQEVQAYLKSINMSEIDYKYYYEKESFSELFFGMSSEHGFAIGKGLASELGTEELNIKT